MIDVLFLFSWALGLLCIIVFAGYAGIGLNRLSIPGFVLLYLVVFQYLGFPILYFRLDDYRAEFVTNDELLLKTFFLSTIAIVLIIFGAVLARSIIGGLIPHGTRRAAQVDMRPLSSRQSIVVGLIGACCICVLIVYVDIVGLPQLALLVAINASAPTTVELARSEMGNAFVGGYYWYQLFMQRMMLLVILLYYASWLISRKSSALPVAFFSIVALFALLVTGEKLPLGNFFISMLLVYCIVKHASKIPVSVAGFAAVAITLLLSLLYVLFSGSHDVSGTVGLTFSRVFTGALQPSYHYIEMFPAAHDYLLGRSLPNPGGLLPFEPFLLTQEVMNYVEPSGISRGVVGSMPAVFWGEMYVNFGIPGVVLSSLLLGFFLYTINAWLVTKINDAVSVALFSWVLVHYSSLAMTSLSTFLIDVPLVIALLLQVLLRASASKSNMSVKT